MDFIPSGSPVCEYIGELKRTKDINDVFDNDYIFEIDCWQTMHGIGGREVLIQFVRMFHFSPSLVGCFVLLHIEDLYRSFQVNIVIALCLFARAHL